MFGFIRNLWLMPGRIEDIDRRTTWLYAKLFLDLCRPRGTRLKFRIGLMAHTVGPVSKTPQFLSSPLSGECLMAVDMTTIDQFTVTVAPKNAKGQPAPVQAPTWLTDNTDVIALAPSSDGLSCKVLAVGIPGTANVQFSCDADMGAGVVTLAGTLEVNVTAAQATTIELVPGPVEVQP